MKLLSLLIVLGSLPAAEAQLAANPETLPEKPIYSHPEPKEEDIDPSLDFIGHKMAWDLDIKFETAWITDEIRPIVIERLLAQHQAARRWPFRLSSRERHLITLGHEPTIQEYLTWTWENPNPFGWDREMIRKNLGKSKHMPAAPAALPYMMDIVYRGSTDRFEDNGAYATQREGACHWVLETIPGFAQKHGVPFPEETQQWAEKMRNEKGYQNEGGPELIQQWYERNKAAIGTGRYTEADWLPRYKGELFINNTAQREARSAEEAREQRALRRPVISSAVESISNSAAFWPTLAAIAALLASCVFYSRRKVTGIP